MAPTTLYTVCVLGAIGLYLVVRPAGTGGAGARAAKPIGWLLALGSLGYLIVGAAEAIPAPDGAGRPPLFYTLFSLIAVVSALKMVTHTRPVYSALYFVLVVLSSAGLFLLLQAEFMAFAIIIIYAGAILITYLFVLMLAQQAPSGDESAGQPEYDLRPREPAAGAVIGFVMLALLSRTMLDGTRGLDAPDDREARVRAWDGLRQLPGRIHDVVAREIEGEFEIVADEGGPRMRVEPNGRSAVVWFRRPDGEPEPLTLPAEARPENVQSVGLALVAKFPASLEMAGVILTMALFGAVILARRQIELTEDEKRAAAGLRRIGHHDEEGADENHAAGGPAGETSP